MCNKINFKISIISRKPNINVKLEHKMPILLDEYYALKLTIVNNEENSIGNIWFVFEKNETSLVVIFLKSFMSFLA